MFGETDIYGTVQIRLDNKGRLFIPTFTKAEPKDELVLSKPNKSFIKITCLQRLKELLADLKVKKLNDNMTQRQIKEIENQIEAIVATTLDVTRVDSQHRILIPKITRELYLPEDHVIMQGAVNHLRMFPNSETFDRYIKLQAKRNQK